MNRGGRTLDLRDGSRWGRSFAPPEKRVRYPKPALRRGWRRANFETLRASPLPCERSRGMLSSRSC